MMTISLALVLCVVQLAMPAPSAVSNEVQVIQGNSLFARNMYNVMAQEEGNLLFSPFSASAVLSMAYQGAGGTTKEAFGKTLHIADPKTAALGYKDVLGRLHASEGVTLANKVFVMEKYNLNKDFQDSVSKNFNSEVQSLNFAKSEESASAINTWVEDKTNKKIKDLIKSDSLSGDTRLVLVNAVHFKGTWAEKFDPKETKSEPFYPKEGSEIKVDMMHTKQHFNYIDNQDLDAKVLEMPFKNENLSMVIILPNKKFGIKEVEQKLSENSLDTILNKMWNVEVDVSLPKFKLTAEMDLGQTLTKMGLGEIFDSRKADFTNMLESKEKLSVSKVVQKAFIEVNEEGAEAAAATGLIAIAISAQLNNFEVNVNRPFILSIVQRNSHGTNNLFSGRILHPKY